MNARHGKPHLYYGQGETPFGPVVLVFSTDGLVALRLLENKSAGAVLREIEQDFPEAELIADPQGARVHLLAINQVLSGRCQAVDLKLDMRGTPFQRRVWEALRRIPRGSTCSYSELARKVGKPRAVRAVASACARNPIGLVVPCHRVLRNDGSLGGYYWGTARKREILRSENVEV